jgi:probable phosphoglycerate mutase
MRKIGMKYKYFIWNVGGILFDVVQRLTYEDIANGLIEIDTAGWAEPWPVIRKRIWTGFEDIAQAMIKQGGGNALVVSHGMTIGTLCSLDLLRN